VVRDLASGHQPGPSLARGQSCAPFRTAEPEVRGRALSIRHRGQSQFGYKLAAPSREKERREWTSPNRKSCH
jgi:hypothetical protein